MKFLKTNITNFMNTKISYQNKYENNKIKKRMR